jgi:hypothetical protein
MQRELCQKRENIAAYVRAKPDKNLATFPAFSLNDDAINEATTFWILPTSRRRQSHRVWSTSEKLAVFHVEDRASLLDVGLYCHTTGYVKHIPPLGRIQRAPDVFGHESCRLS